ncbi:MAG: DUF3124 domain-containing protein [Desulfocapsaceae bacterium]
MKKKNFLCAYFSVLFLTICFSSPLPLLAGENIVLTDGQTIYVPAYSHIYSGNQEKPFQLTVTLSIRNVDPNHPIKLIVVDYHETQGEHLKKLLNEPKVLMPLESLRYVIAERDETGGSGANFIVAWKSDKPINPPIVESVMIGTQSQQGISFVSRGRVIIKSD